MKKPLLVLVLVGLLILLATLFIHLGLNASNVGYVLPRRLFRLMAILLVAFSISLSTLLFQSLTQSRILTPSMLGMDGLYGLMQTAVVFFLGSSHYLMVNKQSNFLLSTFVMVGVSVFLYLFLLKKLNYHLLKLLLIGVVLSTLYRSIQSFLAMVMDPNEFSVVQNRLFASFNAVNTDILMVSFVIVAIVFALIYEDILQLDILSLGKDHSINLGIDYAFTLKKHLVVIALLTAISTALVGPVMFLGLLIINLARQFVKTYNHRHLFFVSFLLGGNILIGSILVIERIFAFNAPLATLINFFGGIFMIYLLFKENKL